MSEEEALAMSKDERVALVQQDQIYSGSASQQVGSWGWGLDRIDQAYRPLNGYYNYYYTGAGVNVYVMDSGIRANHPDFGGRVIGNFDFIGGDGQDCNGHGTHVAGTIGGATVGVAKQVRLINLRVLNCQNNSVGSSILTAINWVTANHVKPAVVNMSLGTLISSNGDPALDYAVSRSIQAGVTYVVAAGNDGRDANNVSPAKVREAITVGASDQNDSRAYFGFDQGRYFSSNYGTALDLFAPGQNILSTGYTNANSGWLTLSGTSMAAPHVAGVAAMYLQYNPNASPATVHNIIVGTANTRLLRYIGAGSPNRLLDSTMQY
jgi:subtilisin family serine protease